VCLPRIFHSLPSACICSSRWVIIYSIRLFHLRHLIRLDVLDGIISYCPQLLASHLRKPSWSHVRHLHHHAVSEVCVDNFRKAYYIVVCFLLGNSPASEFYMPTFRNTLFHLHRRMKTEQTEWSKTYEIQTPGNYPEESIQHSEHNKSLKSSILYS
jgi:hypothetical protein